MKSVKLVAIVLSSAGLLFLGACSSGGNQASTSTSSPAASASASPESVASSSSAAHEKEHSAGGRKGQVVEVGAYHVELVPEKEAGNTHMDVFLQKGDTHEPVTDASVMAQVKTPDGSQKTVDLKYDKEGKHYTAIVPSAAVGEYQAAVLSDIKGEKVNARFSFKQ